MAVIYFFCFRFSGFVHVLPVSPKCPKQWDVAGLRCPRGRPQKPVGRPGQPLRQAVVRLETPLLCGLHQERVIRAHRSERKMRKLRARSRSSPWAIRTT